MVPSKTARHLLELPLDRGGLSVSEILIYLANALQ